LFFATLSTLILDRLVNLPEILNHSKSVQEHLDYDPAMVQFKQDFPQKLVIVVVKTFKLKKFRLKVSGRAGHSSLAHEFAACPRGVLFPRKSPPLYPSPHKGEGTKGPLSLLGRG